MSLQHISGSALEHDFSTFSSGFRSHINNPVGGSHHILVMLHNNDSIAKIAQLFERVYEFDVVALMESDTRLIKDIENVDKLTANLRRESYSLTLTT